MRPAGAEERESRARAVLEEAGLRAVVRSRGIDGEIAAVSGPGSAMEVLRRAAPRLRALGYRYIALDLAAEHRTKE